MRMNVCDQDKRDLRGRCVEGGQGTHKQTSHLRGSPEACSCLLVECASHPTIG